MWMTYLIIAVLLLAAELVYFKIADKCNIIDKPNERSSHSTIVLRGGGVIFAISMVMWLILRMVNGEWCTVQDYLPFMVGLWMVAVGHGDRFLSHSNELSGIFVPISQYKWRYKIHCFKAYVIN